MRCVTALPAAAPSPDAADLAFGFHAMGGPGEIRIAGLPEDRAGMAAAKAVEEVRRIESVYSRYRPDSIVSRLNAAAGGEALPVDDETAALLDFGATLHAESGGRFDLTSGVLRRAWDFRSGRVPTAAAIAALLPLVGWARVEWPSTDAPSPRRLRLPVAGMELDFGGIGKEYAADRAASVLGALGVDHGWVNLGGDIRVVGPQPDGRPWSFGIAHPRHQGAVIAGVSLAAGALATSGDYERYLEVDGQRFGHLLDSRTGWPASDWQSVSVVAPACMAAGAAASIAMLMGPQAPGWLESQGLDYLAIDAGGRLHRPGGPGWPATPGDNPGGGLGPDTPLSRPAR
jgi:thiamine biosynthesis lipoprotein